MRYTAIEAAKRAGAILSRYFETTDLEHIVKDDTSYVTKADKESEEAIVKLISERFPRHGIVGEEGTDVNPEAEYHWIIDPLDGTSNFVNGIPIFAVSIAVAHAGVTIIGVVYNPVTNSLFVAEQGKGTTYNGKPVRVSEQAAAEGLVTFGYTPKERQRARDLFVKTGNHFRSARFLGSIALELGYLARGGIEGLICLGLHKWDYAAGQLLVTEAGGTITDCDGNVCSLVENYFIASNGKAHDELQKLVNT